MKTSKFYYVNLILWSILFWPLIIVLDSYYYGYGSAENHREKFIWYILNNIILPSFIYCSCIFLVSSYISRIVRKLSFHKIILITSFLVNFLFICIISAAQGENFKYILYYSWISLAGPIYFLPILLSYYLIEKYVGGANRIQ